MNACARCGLPLPAGTPEPEVREDGDDVNVLIAVPSGWYPGDGGELVCVRCADDDEINAWVTSAAFGGDAAA